MERETIWIYTTTDCWTLASVVSIQGDTVVAQTKEGAVIKAPKKHVLAYKEFHKTEYDNLIALAETHEAPILYNLYQRYLKDKIYTYIGPVLISINPFKEVNLSSEKILNQYLEESAIDDKPPHLYAIALNAYHSLITKNESQSIVISGESGSGKTEATKIILKYLTVACGRSESAHELSKKILATNPVLEAFGNAKTIRNNNSSRFGKFLSIAFDPGGQLNSASISNYLLETVRVVSQSPNERNYHIFYSLLEGSTPQEKSQYRLKSVADYRYLNHGYIKVDGVNDAQNFIVIKNSLTTLGINDTEQTELFNALSGILHLGNVEFYGNEEAKLRDISQLKTVAALLQVPDRLLVSALTQRFFSGGNRPSGCNIPLSMNQAVENRDALAKALYSRMFDYLVNRLNTPLLGNNAPLDLASGDPRRFIGVLDIYGFEVFEHNSIEQFCINYANEKLHQQFNQHMFKAEQKVYTEEGVSWETIHWTDNQDCIDLIEGFSTGVLAMLDEEGKVPRGSDKFLLDKLIKRHGRNNRFKFKPQKPNVFGIDHYAGLVEYTIMGFLAKNKDTLNRDLISVLWSSESQMIQHLFLEEFEEYSLTATTSKQRQRVVEIKRSATETNNNNPTGSKKATVCSRFQQSLLRLVTILSSSQRHYVRCIKPNDKLVSGVFEAGKVLEQLKSNGIMETVRMRKAGYASHIPYDSFYHRFKFMGIRTPDKQDIQRFLTGFSAKFEDDIKSDLFVDSWNLGRTKVFLREKTVDKLETIRREIYVSSIITFQSYIRRWNSFRLLNRQKNLLVSCVVIQRYVRQWAIKRLYLQILEKKNRQLLCIIIIQKHIRAFNAKRRLLTIYRDVLEMNRWIKSLVVIQKYIRLFNAKRRYVNYLQDRHQQQQLQQQQQKEQQQMQQEQIQKRREEAKRKYEISSLIIQRYIRAWHCRREMIGLVVQKLLELREYEIKKVRELEEQRKVLQDSKQQKDQKKRLSKTIDALTDSSSGHSHNKPSIRLPLNQSLSSQPDPYPDPKSSRKTKKPTAVELQQLDTLLDSREGRKDIAGIPIIRVDTNSNKEIAGIPIIRVDTKPPEELTSPRGHYTSRRNILSTITEKIPTPVTPKAGIQKLTTNFSKIHGFWAHAVTPKGPGTARGATPPKPLTSNGVSAREIKKPELTPAQKKMLRRSRSLDSMNLKDM